MPNDNIMGIPTRACINGFTKEDTERLKNALIKQILNDETVVNVTEDGKIIIANDDGLYLSFDDSVIGLTKDDDDNIIPVADPYIPMDDDDNPLVPANNVIMTSGNIAVDPRIVHTTGNETISGTKTFNNGIDFYPVNWHKTYNTNVTQNKYCIFAEIKIVTNMGGQVFIEFIQGGNTAVCYGEIMFRCLINENESPFPMWVIRKTNGGNNPLSVSSIKIVCKDGKAYLVWKREPPYGNLLARVKNCVSYGTIQPKTTEYIKFFNEDEMIVLDNLSEYTVYDVIE